MKTAIDVLDRGCSLTMIEELLIELQATRIAEAEFVEEFEQLVIDRRAKVSETKKLIEAVARGMGVPAAMATNPQGLAEQCLEEGCPVLTLEELLIQLKAGDNSDAEVLNIIKSMEANLEETKASQSEIEKMVEKVSRDVMIAARKENPPQDNSVSFDPKEFAGRLEKAKKYEKAAENCLEEGCPVLSVENLLLELKATNAADPAILAELEQELTFRKKWRSESEKLVEAVASGTMVPAAMATNPQGLAEQCLEEGCPVLTLEELLIQLKAGDNSDAEVLNIIKSMEANLEQTKASQSEIEKMVEKVSRDVMIAARKENPPQDNSVSFDPKEF